MKNKISDFRNVNKKSGVNYYCCRKAKPRSTLQYKQGNGAGSCNIHGTGPSSAKAVDVIGSGKWMCQGVMVPVEMEMAKMVMVSWW